MDGTTKHGVSQFPVLSVGTRRPFRPRRAIRLLAEGKPSAAEGKPSASTRCLTERAGFTLSDGLATLN
jgi:hypothetical protein